MKKKISSISQEAEGQSSSFFAIVRWALHKLSIVDTMFEIKMLIKYQQYKFGTESQSK